MISARELIRQLRQPANSYALLISLTGIILFAATIRLSFLSYSLEDWVMICAMACVVVILEHFVFQIPPETTQQSMDSSVFLASVFVFGGKFTLVILSISSIILALINRKVTWWKHVINFSIYTLLILSASLVYRLFQGLEGGFDPHNLPAYLFTLTAYFLLNVLLVVFYYYLLYKGTFFQVIRDNIKESLFAYCSTLLLSIVLVILISSSKFYGLFLFLAVGILLSHAFQQLFRMYNLVSEKANTDQRTGLFSHSYFEEKLEEHLEEFRRSGRPFSLALLDLDDFKKYNDAFGHPQGDQLLGLFGRIIKEECEAHGILAARYGGEEFSLIMPGFDKEKAETFINRLRKKVNDTPFEGVHVLPHGCISFSAGISEVTEEIYDKSQLVELADKPLYAAKAKGKNTVCLFGEKMEFFNGNNLEQEINDLEQQIRIFLSKDIYTFKHSKRVFSYAFDMSSVLQLSEEDRRLLILGALIHDIGKLEIPRDVLNKKEKLNQNEWEMVKKHVLWGKEFVQASGKYMELIPLIELHHERYDGKGYPYGLAGDKIPKLARLLTVIDSFDAMTTERPYQETKSYEQAVEELKRCSNTQFDPEFAGVFIRYIEEKFRLRESNIPVA